MRVLSLWLAMAGLSVSFPVVSSGAEPPSRTYYLIITGGELLEGTVADAHTPFITKTLLPLGLKCVGMSLVDDMDEDLAAAYRHATNKAPLVLVTGGLGPTDNDITRQTLSRCTGIPLKEDPDLLAEMARRFNAQESQLRPNLRRQTEVPVRGGFLRNGAGTAAGLVFEMPRGHVIALPGPPRELQTMVRDELIPFLVEHYGIRAQANSFTFRFLGLGQSQIDHTLKQKVSLPAGLIVGSTFEGGRVDFTFSLADDSDHARQTLEKLKKDIMAVLGDNIYAEGQTALEEVVLERLRRRGTRLALVEIGSGGALSAAFARVSPRSAMLAGGWMAKDEAGLFRMLQVPEDRWQKVEPSLPRLELAAQTAAQITGAEVVLVTGAGQRQAGAAEMVPVLLRLPDGKVETQLLFHRGLEESPGQLVTSLLGFLWKKLP